MDEKHFKILEFLSKQTTPIKLDNFPQEIKSDYDAHILSQGSLHYELEIVLKNKKWVEESKTHSLHYSITKDFGKTALRNEKSVRLERLTEGQLQHEILRFLKVDSSKQYFLIQIQEEFPIDKDKLLYLLEEMNTDGNINKKDCSSMEGKNYLISISDKGIGAFAKSEYLKEKKRMPAFQEIHFGDKITTHGNESPAFGKGGTQTNTVQNELPKEKWYKKILNEFVKNAVQYIFTGVVTFIIGVAAGKSCNQHNNQQETKKDTTKIVQVPKKSIKL